jgi:hypothetical protein
VPKKREDTLNVQPATGFSGVLDSRDTNTVPAIPAPDRFTSAVRVAIASPAGQRIRAKHAGLSVALILAGVTEELRTADGNGRSIKTSNATLAKRLRTAGHRCSEATAAKIRYVLRDLGFQTTTEEGRGLTTSERLGLYVLTKKKQWHRAATRVLTLPSEYTGEEGICDLLPVRGGSASSSLRNTHQKNAQARSRSKKSARTKPTPSLTTADAPTTDAQQGHDRPRWSLAQLKLAGTLEHALSPRSGRTPSIPGAPHLGHYCRILARYEIDPGQFTAQDLKNLMNRVLRQRGSHGWVAPKAIANPLAYLRWALSAAHKNGLIAEHIASVQRRTAEAQVRRERARQASQRPTGDETKAHQKEVTQGISVVRSFLQAKRATERAAAESLSR